MAQPTAVGILRLPVTAATPVKVGSQEILICGQGSRIVLIDTRNGACAYSAPLIDGHAVHGIKVIRHAISDTNLSFELLVWGGQTLHRIEARIISDCSELWLSCNSADTIEVNDRILDCDVQILGRTVTILTSYNALYYIDLSEERSFKDMREYSRLHTFLYCGSVSTESDGNQIVTAGTAFGELLTWTYDPHSIEHEDSAASLTVSEGHRGSIFGTCVSEPLSVYGQNLRLVASCSDDRTIRIWTLTTYRCEPQADDNAHDTESATQKASTKYEHKDVFMTWAHASRIWRVEFLRLGPARDLFLVSSGEDATCQLWRVCIEQSASIVATPEIKLEHCYKDRYHSGKNLWTSVSVTGDGAIKIYTGGADGQVASRTLRPHKHSMTQMSVCGDSLSEVSVRAGNTGPLKSYTFEADAHLLATTGSGRLVKGQIHGESIAWKTIPYTGTKQHVILSLTAVVGLSLFYDCNKKSVFMYLHAPDLVVECFVPRTPRISWFTILSDQDVSPSQRRFLLAVAAYDPRHLELICIELQGSQIEVKTQQMIDLPEAFHITSVFHDETFGAILCGSRNGTIAVYRYSSEADAPVLSCIQQRLHGCETITSIIALRSGKSCLLNTDGTRHYITTGRDGKYAVHRISFRDTVDCLSFNTLHIGTPPLGSDIEGAYLTLVAGKTEPSLVIYGFRSTHFVVWNESTQSQIMAVECGGAHRSWAFRPNDQGGQFVWTKAGMLNVATCTQPEHDVLLSGGHGREIKALAVHKRSPTELILATGAEDTDIKLYSYTHANDSTTGTLRSLITMRKHTTGLQHLQFSADGHTLYSAGGVEELFSWRLSTIPTLELGAVHLASVPRDDGQSDARIMSFDVETNEITNNDRLVVAYSNGKARAFDHAPIRSSRTLGIADQAEAYAFVPIWQIDFGALCLTQALFNVPFGTSAPGAFLGATSGYISCLNDLSDLVTPASRKIHQNSIAAMCIAEIMPSQTNHSASLLVTGGDDSALALTLVTHTPSGPVFDVVRVPRAHATAVTALAVVRIPKEFKSSLNEDGQCFVVVSAGNDQRVQSWLVSVVCDTKLEAAGQSSVTAGFEGRAKQASDVGEWMQITPLDNQYTNVADISSMDVLRTGTKMGNDSASTDPRGTYSGQRVLLIEVLVAGVGMESVFFKVPNNVVQ